MSLVKGLVRRGAGVATAALVALAGTTFGAPPADAGGAPPALAGRTKVVATTSSWMRVRVPRDASLAIGFTESFDGLDGVSFDEGDGLAAVALAPQVADPQPVAAVRLPRAENRLVDAVGLGPRNCQTEAACELPAGTYRLYVVTDRPVTVELVLRGLSGTTRLRPKLPVGGATSGAEHERFHSTPYTATAASMWGVGFTPQVKARYGMLFYSFWFNGSSTPAAPVPPADHPLLQVGISEACFYDGAPTEETAFLPGCVGGLPRGGQTALKALDDHRYTQWGSEVGVTSGSYGLGANVIHTGIFDRGFAGFWLDLTPPA